MSKLRRPWSVHRGIHEALSQIALMPQKLGRFEYEQNFVLTERKSELFEVARQVGDWQYIGCINPEDLVYTVRDLESCGSSECVLIKILPRHPVNQMGIRGLVRVLAVGEFGARYTGDQELGAMLGNLDKKQRIESASTKYLLDNYDIESLVCYVMDPHLNTGDLECDPQFRSRVEDVGQQYHLTQKFMEHMSVRDLITYLKDTHGAFPDLGEEEDSDETLDFFVFGGGFVEAHGGNIRNLLHEAGFTAYSGRAKDFLKPEEN